MEILLQNHKNRHKKRKKVCLIFSETVKRDCDNILLHWLLYVLSREHTNPMPSN